MAGRLLGIVGPSGVGKDSVMEAVAAARPGIGLVRRVITRPSEAGGEEFEGVGEAEFAARAARGAFLLSWRAHGLHYGIPATVLDELAAGRDLLVNLSRAVLPEAQAKVPGFACVALTAPAEVLADRLAARGRESREEIAGRLARAGFCPAGGRSRGGTGQFGPAGAHRGGGAAPAGRQAARGGNRDGSETMKDQMVKDEMAKSTTDELILANATLVLPGETRRGHVVIRGGEIAEIGSGAVPAGAVDCEGDFLSPGLIELHTDNLERHITPRPKAHWPHNAAIVAHDAELAGCGITTVFDAIRVGSIVEGRAATTAAMPAPWPTRSPPCAMPVP